MAVLLDHPTVQEVRRREANNNLPSRSATIESELVSQLMQEAGADDYGFVSIDRPEIDDQRDDILAASPQTKTLISFCCRMNRGPIRSTARSVANLEFHHTGERVNEVARSVVRQLEELGYEAINPAMGFPMEMDRFPIKPWAVSHKPIAVAAGLGQIGIHRNVIHPKFGNFILLGTILLAAEVTIGRATPGAATSAPQSEGDTPGASTSLSTSSDAFERAMRERAAVPHDGDKDVANPAQTARQPMTAPVTAESRPVDFNPCLGCKLCVAACPVGAISPNGDFNFTSCYAHNYREFMTGFIDWAERSIGSKPNGPADAATNAENVSFWQSLSFGPNYKAAYCLAVCPAGEDVISPFLDDRGQFIAQHVKPLQAKLEPIYVQPDSDAEDYVARKFPHKEIRRTGYVFKAHSIHEFITMMQHAFQPGKSKGLNAVYHFRFTGGEPAECTVTIRDQKIEVRDGHVGTCNLRVTADAASWVRFLKKETNIAWLIATLRVRMWGDPRLLVMFGKCFP